MTEDGMPLFAAYNRTFGSVPTATSIEREEHERTSGVASERAKVVLNTLLKHPNGLTWRELGEMLNLHHGQISGALSNLHRLGFVFCTSDKRHGCQPYFHIDHLPIHEEKAILHPVQTRAGIRKQAMERAMREIKLLNEAQCSLSYTEFTEILETILRRFDEETAPKEAQ